MKSDMAVLPQVLRCLAVRQPGQIVPDVSLTAEGVEDMLEGFRNAALVLAEHYLPRGSARLVTYAYDSGIARGFYGMDSAIAKGLSGRFLSEFAKRFDECEVPEHGAVERIFEVGCIHGRTLRQCAEPSR